MCYDYKILLNFTALIERHTNICFTLEIVDKFLVLKVKSPNLFTHFVFTKYSSATRTVITYLS